MLTMCLPSFILSNFSVFYLIPMITLCDRYYEQPHFIKKKILHKVHNVLKIIQLESSGASFKLRASTSNPKPLTST